MHGSRRSCYRICFRAFPLFGWVLAFPAICWCQSTGDGPAADLIYNPFTGDVILDAADTRSNRIESFVLANGENSFRTENFVESFPGNLGPYIDTGTNTDNTPFQIGQANPLGGLTEAGEGQTPLGAIFPVGMRSVTELAGYLTLREYAAELGLAGTFDLLLCIDAECLTTTASGSIDPAVNTRAADLLYSVSTGNVWLKPSRNGFVDSFTLSNDVGGFLPDNFVAPLNGADIVATGSQISQARLENVRFTESVALGSILPSGLANGEQLAEFLTQARYNGGNLDLLVCRRDDCSDLRSDNADFDGDGDVDAVDGVIAQNHGIIPGGAFFASNETGDANHDRVVDDTDIQIAQDQWTGVQSTPTIQAAGNTVPSHNADLVYSPFTGEVWLQSSPNLHNRIRSFVIANADGTFRDEQFNAPFSENVLTDQTVHQLGQFQVNHHPVPELHSLGTILPVGIRSAEELSGYLTEARYSRRDLGEPTDGPGTFDLLVCETDACFEHLPNGDFDTDGDIDTFDLLKVQRNQVTNGGFADGDANRDGLIAPIDRQYTQSTWTGVIAPAPSSGTTNNSLTDTENANLIYNVETGETWLKSEDNNTITGFVLSSSEEFEVEGLRLPFGDDGANTDSFAQQVGQVVVTGTESFQGYFNLGPVITAGKSAAQIADFFTVAEYIGSVDGSFDLLVCEGRDCLDLLPNGDVDADGDVDVRDASLVTGFIDRQDFPLSYDANRSNDISVDDFETVRQQLTGAISVGAASGAGDVTPDNDALLIYNPFNGEVHLEPSKVRFISSFVIANADGGFRTDNFMRPTVGAAAIVEANPRQIGAAQPVGAVAGRLTSLGEILPAGFRSAVELSDYLTLAEYSSSFRGSGQLDLVLCETESCAEILDPIRELSAIGDGPDADAIYNPFTGNMKINGSDTETGKVISFVFGNNDSSFDTDAVELPYFYIGLHNDPTPYQVGQTDALNGATIDPGETFDLGNFMPTGIETPRDLRDYLTIYEYASDLGAGGRFDLLVCGDLDCTFFVPDDSLLVPEPSGIMPFLVGAMACVAARRRFLRLGTDFDEYSFRI